MLIWNSIEAINLQRKKQRKKLLSPMCFSKYDSYWVHGSPKQHLDPQLAGMIKHAKRIFKEASNLLSVGQLFGIQ